MLKSLAMVVVGLLLGIVGSDVNFRMKRFCFGFYELTTRWFYLIIAVSARSSEWLGNLSEPEDRVVFTSKVGSLYPTLQDMKQSITEYMRNDAWGVFCVATDSDRLLQLLHG